MKPWQNFSFSCSTATIHQFLELSTAFWNRSCHFLFWLEMEKMENHLLKHSLRIDDDFHSNFMVSWGDLQNWSKNCRYWGKSFMGILQVGSLLLPFLPCSQVGDFIFSVPSHSSSILCSHGPQISENQLGIALFQQSLWTSFIFFPSVLVISSNDENKNGPWNLVLSVQTMWHGHADDQVWLGLQCQGCWSS